VKLPSPIAAHWNESCIFVDAAGFFDRLLAAIDAAKSSIEFEYYIFDLDSLGERFVAALSIAAARGVTVRVIMDGVGSSRDATAISRRLTDAGAEVRIYHPLPWVTGSYRWSRSGGGILYKFLSFLLNINRRDHRKLCVVDGARAWVGSFNITVDHLPVSAGGLGWRDYGVELSGPRVETLVEGFDAIWWRTRPRLQRGFIAGFLGNRGLRERGLKNRFVSRSVVNSRHRVWLVSAYFLPTAALRRALLHACRGGAEVCLILPEHSDIRYFPGLSSHYYRELLRAGARIFLFRPGVLHAKALLVDDFAIIGSSNWNYRSTLHDLELDVVLRHPTTLMEMETIVRRDASDSLELVLSDIRQPGALSRLLYVLRYWM
jgi:cardiolipin synthase